jgi:hypothetical protein
MSQQHMITAYVGPSTLGETTGVQLVAHPAAHQLTR